MPKRDQRGYTKENVVSGEQRPANQDPGLPIAGPGATQATPGADQRDVRSAGRMADRITGELPTPPGRQNQ